MNMPEFTVSFPVHLHLLIHGSMHRLSIFFSVPCCLPWSEFPQALPPSVLVVYISLWKPIIASVFSDTFHLSFLGINWKKYGWQPLLTISHIPMPSRYNPKKQIHNIFLQCGYNTMPFHWLLLRYRRHPPDFLCTGMDKIWFCHIPFLPICGHLRMKP